MNDRIVMPVWTIGLFIVVMNTTMFNVSIPSIIQDLHITADLGSWVISSYSIGYALSTVIYSRLSDTVTIRKLLAVGLCVLGFSSVLGLFAHSFGMLLTARILQSAGAGVMAGLGLVLASRYIPAERRGSAIAMISAGSAMAFGLGPIVGGIISEYFGWNGLFAVTCLVLVILPVLLRLLPREEAPPFRFDLAGALMTVVNAATLLLAVTQLSWVWLAVSIASFAVHAWHLRRGQETFINPALLRNGTFLKLVTIGFCLLILNLGNLFLMPLILAKAFSLSAMRIGLTIAPGAILSAFLTRFVGRWIDRYGNVRFLLLGHGLLALVLLSFFAIIGTSPAVILLGYIVFSPAFSATLAALNNETSRMLPKQLIGAGMGLMQLIQFFGGSISVAVCGLLLELQTQTPLVSSYKHVYGMLLAVGVISLGMLLWYKQSKNERQPI
ncbi:MFS transporter [Paenibacillus sp. GCM10023248]|uniref:MFS transporter n=1 Tax=Bacillales TaxID=1385 RepID=UPI002378D2BE|nr:MULTISPECIES: MFS transporter [Bacillales]MDD9270481.1 MFS transporter [Paenibacillus sp. MAHUQ-63]MDR6884153.1 DHA2 family metal-tetracycline-proton antiporter-like MFS transporter [Bacillus sp. 3255]